MSRGIFWLGVLLLCFLALLIIPMHFDRERACPRRLPRQLKRRQYHPVLSWYNIWIQSVAPKHSLRPIISKPAEINTYFPGSNVFRRHYKTIQNEAYRAAQDTETKEIRHDRFFTTIADTRWKRFYLKWYGPISSSARRLCPQTTRLIEKHPQIQLAMFSILEPGARISPHRGPFRGCFRYHLGVDTPNDDRCRIRVRDEYYSWRNGEDVLFDDTYYHEVKNDTNRTRIVLFMDVKRGLNGAWANQMNDYMCKKIAPIASGKNAKQEQKDANK
jgi:beta-hydroxylase